MPGKQGGTAKPLKKPKAKEKVVDEVCKKLKILILS